MPLFCFPLPFLLNILILSHFIILVCSASYGSDAPPALGGGENLDRLGLKRDPVEALHVHKIAATLGDAASQQAIGVSFATEKEESSGNGLAVLYEVWDAFPTAK